MTIPIAIEAGALYTRIVNLNAPCINNLQSDVADFIDDFGDDAPFTIARVPYNLIIEYTGRIQEELIDIQINSYEACTELRLQDIFNANDVELAFPGICDNVVYNSLGDLIVDLTTFSPVFYLN